MFRAAADGRRTAEGLAARGHAAVLAPVIAIVPLAPTLADCAASAVVFTSAHGPPACPAAVRAALGALPCFCVGARTAAAAVAAGFSSVRAVSDDARALAAMIAAALPGSSRVVLLAGRDRKPVLEESLARAGFAVSALEVYAAVEAAPWPAAALDALAGCDGALHYSRRSAALAAARVRLAGLRPLTQNWTHFCLSADVAAGLRADAGATVRVADKPDDASLLALLPS